MTTKEFIKMLEEADPTGEMHVRMNGGIPYLAEPKPGYWDGSYDYLDEDGNWVKSREGNKVDIWTMDVFDFVEKQMDIHGDDIAFSEIEKKIIFKGISDRDSNGFLNRVKNSYNELRKINEDIKNGK